MSTSYRPRPGTLPAKLLDWLAKNHDEELTRVDVASKFGLAPSTVALGLEAAVKAGALVYEHNDDLTLVYRLPKAGRVATVASPWAAAATSSPPAQQAQAKQRTPTPVVAPPSAEELQQLLSLVEKGKPIPKPGTSSRPEKWAPVLAVLREPDTSVPIRAEWVRGLKCYASLRNKRHKAANEPQRFTVGVDEQGAPRVWRTA